MRGSVTRARRSGNPECGQQREAERLVGLAGLPFHSQARPPGTFPVGRISPRLPRPDSTRLVSLRFEKGLSSSLRLGFLGQHWGEGRL